MIEINSPDNKLLKGPAYLVMAKGKMIEQIIEVEKADHHLSALGEHRYEYVRGHLRVLDSARE